MKRNNPSSRGTFEVFATACATILIGVSMAFAQAVTPDNGATTQPLNANMGPHDGDSYQPRSGPTVMLPPLCFNGLHAFTITANGKSEYQCPASLGSGNVPFCAGNAPANESLDGDIARYSCPFSGYQQPPQQFAAGSASSIAANLQPPTMDQKELRQTQQLLHDAFTKCSGPNQYVIWVPRNRTFRCGTTAVSEDSDNMGPSQKGNYQKRSSPMMKRVLCPDQKQFAQTVNGSLVCSPDYGSGGSVSCAGGLQLVVLAAGNVPGRFCLLQ